MVIIVAIVEEGCIPHGVVCSVAEEASGDRDRVKVVTINTLMRTDGTWGGRRRRWLGSFAWRCWWDVEGERGKGEDVIRKRYGGVSIVMVDIFCERGHDVR